MKFQSVRDDSVAFSSTSIELDIDEIFNEDVVKLVTELYKSILQETLHHAKDTGTDDSSTLSRRDVLSMAGAITARVLEQVTDRLVIDIIGTIGNTDIPEDLAKQVFDKFSGYRSESDLIDNDDLKDLFKGL